MVASIEYPPKGSVAGEAGDHKGPPFPTPPPSPLHVFDELLVSRATTRVVSNSLDELSDGRATTRVAPTFLNEQGHLALFGTIDEGGYSGDFGHDGLQVFEFQVKEFHGHAAGIDVDVANLHGAFEGLHPGGDFLRHHLLHHDLGIIFEILADA